MFGSALSMLRERGAGEACKEAVRRYKHLFDIGKLQLKNPDDQNDDDGGVKQSDSVKY